MTPINPLVPTVQDRALASGMLANRLPSTLTLQEAAREAAKTLPISSSTTSSPRGVAVSSTTRATAAKSIANKPVNVFGMRYGHDVRHLMQSLADLYGLQLLVPSRNDYTLALPEHRTLTNLKDFPKEIQRLTPLPLRRALVDQKESFAALIEASPEDMAGINQQFPEGMSEEAAQRIRKNAIASRAQFKASDAFYFAATRRLIALTEPKVSGPDAPLVPVHALAPEADRLLALMLLSGAGMRELQGLQNFVLPLSLTQPKAAHFEIIHTESPNLRIYMVGIFHLASDGSVVSEGDMTLNIFEASKDPPQSGALGKPRN